MQRTHFPRHEIPTETSWKQDGVHLPLQARWENGTAQRQEATGLPFNDTLLRQPAAGARLTGVDWSADQSGRDLPPPSFFLDAQGQVTLNAADDTTPAALRSLARAFASNVSALSGPDLDAWADRLVPGQETTVAPLWEGESRIYDRRRYQGTLVPHGLETLFAGVGANVTHASFGQLQARTGEWTFSFQLPTWSVTAGNLTYQADALGHAQVQADFGELPKQVYLAKVNQAVRSLGLPPPPAEAYVHVKTLGGSHADC